MVSPFHSPAPWTVNASGGARTIVARDRSVVAVVLGNGSAAPFDVGNGALMAAAPDLRDALRRLVDISGQIGLLDNGVEDARRAALDALQKAAGP